MDINKCEECTRDPWDRLYLRNGKCYRTFFNGCTGTHRKVLPNGLTDKGFENFEVLDCLKKAFEKSKEFLNGSKSLYLYGTPGNGKTHLLAASYNEAFKVCPKESRVAYCYYNVDKLVRFKRHEFQTKEEAESDVIEDIMKYDLVYLDDLLVETANERNISFLYQLFNQAIENGKPRFFITANQSIEFISKKMSDRIASRIAQLCGKENIIKNLGEDRRLK
jgi:DNA replication protein DnaC